MLLKKRGPGYLINDLPSEMVEESKFHSLVTALQKEIGETSTAGILKESGERTAKYLLKVRIPGPFQTIVKLLPASLAFKVLLFAISKNAWTFAGSGEFSYGSKPSPNIVVKVPLIEPGVRLVRTLSDRGIKTNVTLVFSVSQALLAAKAGATFISNFVGRVDDISDDGMDAVADTVAMVSNYGFSSQVLVASVRHPLHVVQAVQAGAHISTMPFKVMQALFKHPLTDIGLKRFLDDWNQAGLSIF
jgi:TalC/MipB family fructose-6-phosphate aldolase